MMKKNNQIICCYLKKEKVRKVVDQKDPLLGIKEYNAVLKGLQDEIFLSLKYRVWYFQSWLLM